ncbi:MAG: hypothetical protein WAV20_26125, partial [Blastocatellia bacterium]
MRTFRLAIRASSLLLMLISIASAQSRGLQSSDLLKLRSIGEVKYSPDALRLAYTVVNNDGSARPYPQLWIMTPADGKSARIGNDREPSSN